MRLNNISTGDTMKPMAEKVQCVLTNPSKRKETLKELRIRKSAARYQRILRHHMSSLAMTENEAHDLAWFIAERMEKLRCY